MEYPNNETEYDDEDFDAEPIDGLAGSIEGPALADRAAHAESGASEFSRRSGGALTSVDIPEQFAERDRSLESEHAQNPDELGIAFLMRATQDEPPDEQPEADQPLSDPERPADTDA